MAFARTVCSGWCEGSLACVVVREYMDGRPYALWFCLSCALKYWKSRHEVNVAVARVKAASGGIIDLE